MTLKKQQLMSGAVLALCLMCACSHPSAGSHDGHNHEATEAAEEAAHAHSGEIVLPPAKARAAGVVVQTVEPGPFCPVIRTSGQVLAAQGDERMAVATVAGVVTFSGKVTEGMSVKAGTPLVVLSSRHMAEGDPVQKARVAYEVSRKEYERKEALAESRIVSQKDLAQARQTYENARIAYEALAKTQTAQGQVVGAPMAGYVKSLLVKEGDYVQVGQPLVSVTQNRRLFLRADVSERYYAALPSVRSAHFCTPYDEKVYALDQLDGRLLSYGKASGEGGYYIPVTFEFDNRGDVVPGSFVEVYLLGAPEGEVISLPRTALTEEQGSIFVYLQADKECYVKQRVTLGADDGQRVQVLSGLKPGDRVVTAGAYQVKLAGATSAIPPHTHEH